VRHNPTETDIREYFWPLVDKNGPLPDPATGSSTKDLALLLRRALAEGFQV
jgi:hypothetical protein